MMPPMDKQDFDIVCRHCKEVVAGEVSDRGHICHKVDRTLKPPSLISPEERDLQHKLELIVLKYANDHRIEHHGDAEGWVIPSITKEINSFIREQRIRWYYIGLFDGLDTDELGEKRQYTETDLSYHVYAFKEKLLEQISKLFVHTLRFPPSGKVNELLEKKEVIGLIKSKL